MAPYTAWVRGVTAGVPGSRFYRFDSVAVKSLVPDDPEAASRFTSDVRAHDQQDHDGQETNSAAGNDLRGPAATERTDPSTFLSGEEAATVAESPASLGSWPPVASIEVKPVSKAEPEQGLNPLPVLSLI